MVGALLYCAYLVVDEDIFEVDEGKRLHRPDSETGTKIMCI